MMSNYREPISFQQYLLGKPLVFFYFQKWIHEFHSISQKNGEQWGEGGGPKKKKQENMIGKKGTKLIGGGFLLFRGGVQPFFFYIKIVLPPQRDQINRGRFFNPESTLYVINTIWLYAINQNMFIDMLYYRYTLH